MCGHPELVSIQSIEDGNKDRIAKCMCTLDELSVSFEGLRSSIVSHENNGKKIKTDIETYVAEIIRDIEGKKRQLLKEVDDHLKEINWNVNNQLEDISERSSTLDQLKTNMKEKLNTCSFQNLTDTNEHILLAAEEKTKELSLFAERMKSTIEKDTSEGLCFMHGSQEHNVNLGHVQFVVKGR